LPPSGAMIAALMPAGLPLCRPGSTEVSGIERRVAAAVPLLSRGGGALIFLSI
jgi:hypothetical protein